MSRQPQLPPRCPFQKKNVSVHDRFSSMPCKDTSLYPQHHKSISQSFILEEQPVWLDDLLSDSDSSSKLKSHRRAASDSGTVLDGLIELPSLNTLKDDKDSCSGEVCTALESGCIYGPNSPRSLIELPSLNALKDDTNSCSREVSTALESGCIYGPNSPRSKEKVSFPENAIVSELSDYGSQRPVPYMDGKFFVSGIPHFDSVQDACGSAGEANVEIQPAKRHSGQRSRVRKLQYIAELERTVDMSQSLVSELAVNVDSLLQQRAYLSMENRRLNQQMVKLHQEKLAVDGQYRTLRKEAEGLKLCVAYSPDGKVSTYFRPNSAGETARSEAIWQMLDMSKLQIN